MAALSGLVTIYGTGTVTVGAGDLYTVTGTGTTWTRPLTTRVDGSVDANYFTVDKINYHRIATFVSATQITLATPLSGAVTGVDYSIVGSVLFQNDFIDVPTTDYSRAIIGVSQNARLGAGGESWS
jgi:hypothetical protein